MAASARRRGGRRRATAAGRRPAERMRRRSPGTTTVCRATSDWIAQLRHLVSELVSGAEKKTASKLSSPGKAGEDAGRERGGQRRHAAATGGTVSREAGMRSEGAADGAARAPGADWDPCGAFWAMGGVGTAREQALVGASRRRRVPGLPASRPARRTAIPGYSAARPHRAAGAAMSGNSTDEPSSIARSRR